MNKGADMTQIKDTTELDFCDVLFKPKRTTLNSRSEADVIREYKVPVRIVKDVKVFM